MDKKEQKNRFKKVFYMLKTYIHEGMYTALYTMTQTSGNIRVSIQSSVID